MNDVSWSKTVGHYVSGLHRISAGRDREVDFSHLAPDLDGLKKQKIQFV